MTRSTRLIRIGAAALLFATTGAFAQEPPSPSDSRHAGHHDPVAAATQPDTATKTEEEVGASAEPQTGMDLEAIEAEVDLLVTRMNDSQGASKVDAMANLLAALVRQQRAMCGAMRAEGAGDGGCCQGQRPPARTPPHEDHGPGHK